ncbi:hypothetical protein FDP41_001345 [Naegleria fowleri]|uniref:Tryptophan synthase beta chain-like PALP domain-containing protein n=1 Tax=Naegleria fowleri TaxID=5763 RepID=A0A6A5BR88_NAEFO|nr:uncharacterized protein FDP41_001345 [Naegleria fowleri]KAF0979677.1 hypothetical protein FDP41_001345 [Naegleria fowleri]CAG4711167.1 unnamed protein product [Naegleria fowleri]
MTNHSQVARVTPQTILEGERLIRNIVKRTSLDTCLSFQKHFPDFKGTLLLKCENEQYTGSFKLRGATHKMMKYLSSIKRDDNDNYSDNPHVSSLNNNLNNNNLGHTDHHNGEQEIHLRKFQNNETTFQVCTASTGNHGFAVSYAAKALGTFSAIVVVPTNADPSKIENIQKVMGGQVILHGDNCLKAEMFAKEYARERNIPYISPYNDVDIVIGQGSIGVEICEQLQEMVQKRGSVNGIQMMQDGSNVYVYVSVGGGGLISGIATYMKHVYPKCKIIACQPSNSAVMYYSSLANKILDNVEEFDTISDGTAGGIEEDSLTFDLCQALVDRYVLLSEDEIYEMLRFLLMSERLLVEGAAACALAGVKKDYMEDSTEQAIRIAVLCGKNISEGKIKKIVSCE